MASVRGINENLLVFVAINKVTQILQRIVIEG